MRSSIIQLVEKGYEHWGPFLYNTDVVETFFFFHNSEGYVASYVANYVLTSS